MCCAMHGKLSYTHLLVLKPFFLLSRGPTNGRPEEPGGARRSPEEPGGARRRPERKKGGGPLVLARHTPVFLPPVKTCNHDALSI